MNRAPFFRLGLAVFCLMFLSPFLRSQEAGRTEPAYLRVLLPTDAQLEVEGAKTTQTGSERHFVSPPLAAGQHYVYTLKATWMVQGKEVVHEKKVRVRPGEEAVVDLRPQAGPEPKKQERKPDIIYVPTPQPVVNKMLELAEVKKDDMVYDLGCGDGRIVVAAAKKYGAKAVGFDIDPERVQESQANVKKNNVDHLVTIEQKDIFTLDLSQADIVTLYLYPDLNVRLIPQLEKLKPGSRIVSHDFDMKGVKPDKVVRMKSSADGREREHIIYLWVTPLKKDK